MLDMKYGLSLFKSEFFLPHFLLICRMKYVNPLLKVVALMSFSNVLMTVVNMATKL